LLKGYKYHLNQQSKKNIFLNVDSNINDFSDTMNMNDMILKALMNLSKNIAVKNGLP